MLPICVCVWGFNLDNLSGNLPLEKTDFLLLIYLIIDISSYGVEGCEGSLSMLAYLLVLSFHCTGLV